MTSGLQKICDKIGNPIKAQFSVEFADGETSVVVESRGGSIGAPNERNVQYSLGVELLLGRLAENNCRLVDAVVDTRATQRMSLSREQRRLYVSPFPIDLRSVDLTSFRNELCRAQRPIGRRPGATGSGNNTKRMRLYVSGLTADVYDAASILSRHPINSVSDEDISPAVRPLRKSQGQGRHLNTQERRAIELRAMHVVQDHLSINWPSVKDVSATESCDFICSSNNRKLYVEVKGTTGKGDKVIVTRNEVALARAKSPNTLLAVVSDIELKRSTDPPIGRGGNLVFVDPWTIQPDKLEPLAFELKIK